MFERATRSDPDPILGVMDLFRADPRHDKIDLTIGAYRDESGVVSIMSAVKQAEAQLVAAQVTKAYVGLKGHLEFCGLISELVLGVELFARARTCQTTGGSAAIRLLAELARSLNDKVTIWLPDTTWANHIPLIGAAGCRIRRYPYYQPAAGSVDFDVMLTALGKADAGDVVLLQACCHNPTGANLSNAQWIELSELFSSKGILPFVDVAYAGLGVGLEQDVFGLRAMASRLPEMMISVSCSKSFTIYSERVGAAIVVGSSSKELDLTFSKLLDLTRGMYFMPPDHGAAVVAGILGNPRLSEIWHCELASMRSRIARKRTELVSCLRRASGTDSYDFIGKQVGMFSLLPEVGRRAEQLRQTRGVYIPVDGRINIAGVTDPNIPALAAAIIGTAPPGTKRGFNTSAVRSGVARAARGAS